MTAELSPSQPQGVAIAGDPGLSLYLITQLADALGQALEDPGRIRARVQEIEGHAPAYPEVRFCKGCVLPVLDSVVTALLHTEQRLTKEEIRSTLLCEGQSTLPAIYSPGDDQSGFGGVTWGQNWQRISKSGQVFADDQRGSRPCPDFGVLCSAEPPLALLGEVKYAGQQSRGTLTKLIDELHYCMAIPIEPDKGWHYNYGVGIFYAAAGDQPRRTRLITDYWRSHRFAVIAIQE